MTKFRYTVEVEVTLTDEELYLLGTLSKGHYDAWCRSISAPGGFLYGVNNYQTSAHAEDPETNPPHVMSFRHIDTLCKILEMRSTLSPVQSLLSMTRPRLLDTAEALFWRLHGYLNDINAESRRLNTE